MQEKLRAAVCGLMVDHNLLQQILRKPKKKKKSNLELGNNIFSQQTYLLRMLKNSLYFQGKVFRCVYGLDYSKGRSCM